jgi:hypothetical protein
MYLRVFSSLVNRLLPQKTAAKFQQGAMFMSGDCHQLTAVLSE